MIQVVKARKVGDSLVITLTREVMKSLELDLDSNETIVITDRKEVILGPILYIGVEE